MGLAQARPNYMLHNAYICTCPKSRISKLFLGAIVKDGNGKWKWKPEIGKGRQLHLFCKQTWGGGGALQGGYRRTRPFPSLQPLLTHAVIELHVHVHS